MKPAEKKSGNRGSGSIYVVWEFLVKRGCQGEFEKVYGPSGEWAKLFKRSKGFESSMLLMGHGAARQYLTIDYWSSQESYDSFLCEFTEDYNELDARCRTLTSKETHLGTFHRID